MDKQSGTEQDFTQPVVYTVTSEDGIVRKQYTVAVVGKEKDINLDAWTTVKSETSGSTERY